MKTGILAQQSGKENPTNLLSNGDFENWSAGTAVAPDGWASEGGGIAVAREATIIKQGTYSCKITRSGADCDIYRNDQAAKGITYWKSRTVTYSCWVWCDTANTARLGMYDNADHYSAFHSGGSTWELLSITLTMSASSTHLQTRMHVFTNNTSAYFDGAMLVEGESAFAFSDKPAGESVLVDYFATSTIVGWAATPTGNIMVKKIGKTVFVSYTITGTSNNATTTFTLPYTSNATYGPVYVARSIDNGATAVPAYASIAANSATASVRADLAGNVHTASGTKTIHGQFFYESL